MEIIPDGDHKLTPDDVDVQSRMDGQREALTKHLGKSTYDFGYAFNMLTLGETVARFDWDEEMYLHLQQPDENSMLTDPYICLHFTTTTSFEEGIEVAADHIVPWIPTPTDLLASDWYRLG